MEKVVLIASVSAWHPDAVIDWAQRVVDKKILCDAKGLEFSLGEIAETFMWSRLGVSLSVKYEPNAPEEVV